MAKKTSQSQEPKYETPKMQSISPEELAKLENAKRAEAAEKIKKMLDEIKSKAEGFKTEALKQFKKEVLGISLLPPKGEGQPLDILCLLQTEGAFEEKFKKKDEIEKKLKEIAQKKIPNINISTAILDEVWDMCFKGKYDILGLLAMSMPLYDGGWLGALRMCEIHKQMVLKKFEKYVVSYVIGGSMVRGTATPTSDVDSFIVIDDTDVTRMTASELVSKLRAIIWGMAEEAATAAGVQNKLNIQIYILTDMWNSIKSANPVIFTFLRDGIPLYDRGMFAPWKLLLKQGKISPTPEAIETYLKSGNQILDRVKWKLKDIAMEDIYWATQTPIQGALMMLGVAPPAPVETAAAMKEHLVKPGLLEEKWLKIWEQIIGLRKDIEHGRVKDVTAKQVEELFEGAEKMLARLDKLMKQIETQTVKKEIKVLYDKTMEDVLAALKMIDVKATEEDALKQFEKNLVDRKLAPVRYLELLKKIADLNKEQKGSLAEISSMTFEQERLAKDTFDHIRAEKGKKVEKYKISAHYGDDKKADIWLLSDIAFIVMDTSRADTPIKKFIIAKDGALTAEKSATLKELNETVEKFAGTPTTLTKATIESLKKVLADNFKLVVGA
ncbi:MAG: nucleotidyltransferase domain-containing protein [Candidatus Nanoarchaeia archaeon]